MSQNKKKLRNEIIKGLSLLSQIGIMIVTCIFIGVWLGSFLDNVLDTSPWFMLLFSLFGAAAAFRFLMDYENKI